MITTKIKTLFQFIEFLHSNIDNFNLNNDLIRELELLNLEEQKMKLKRTFKDKLKYDEVQAEIETKFKILQDNTSDLIKAKAKELNVCNFDNEPNYSFNGIETDIHQLKENFSKDDLPEIFKHKQQYIEYRTKTHKTFLSLTFFIDELDEVTKSLFDYFIETKQNEFEAFETKAIQVNDLNEAVELLSIGKNKVSVPINSKQPRNNLQFTTHEKLFEAVIFSINESENIPIEGAFELLKEVWFFLNSDTATFNGKDIEKYKRPLLVNPIIVGKPEFEEFFEADITYCLTQNKIGLKEQDFIKDISDWIKKKCNEESLSIPRKRKFNEFIEFLKTKALPPQMIFKKKPELIGKLIIFKNSETIEKIHSELKGYFPNKEAELFKALQGEQLSEILLFPNNQNKFVEVFRRLKYNGFLLNSDTETKNWICTTFQFLKKGFAEPQPFNKNSVWDNLNKGKGEPTRKERICITEWLPYKNSSQLSGEKDKEKL
jgi:hypothetical protein